jgi:hypothetical protein
MTRPEVDLQATSVCYDGIILEHTPFISTFGGGLVFDARLIMSGSDNVQISPYED